MGKKKRAPIVFCTKRTVLTKQIFLKRNLMHLIDLNKGGEQVIARSLTLHCWAPPGGILSYKTSELTGQEK